MSVLNSAAMAASGERSVMSLLCTRCKGLRNKGLSKAGRDSPMPTSDEHSCGTSGLRLVWPHSHWFGVNTLDKVCQSLALQHTGQAEVHIRQKGKMNTTNKTSDAKMFCFGDSLCCDGERFSMMSKAHQDGRTRSVPEPSSSLPPRAYA
eukprot:3461618-Amphidinium_carterae.1